MKRINKKHCIFIFILLLSSSAPVFASFVTIEDDVYTNLKGPVKSCLFISKEGARTEGASFFFMIHGNKVIFNREGKIIERIYSTKLDNLEDKIVYYFYDDKGNIIKEIERYGKVEVEIPYLYDNQNRIIEKVNEHVKFLYRYEKNKVIRDFFRNKKYRSTLILYLDNNNFIIKEETIRKNKIIQTVIYEYNSENILIKKTESSYDSELVTTIYFNLNGSIKEVVLSKDGKAVKTFAYTYVEYDSYNNWTKREIYVIEGKKKKLFDVELREIEYYETHE